MTTTNKNNAVLDSKITVESREKHKDLLGFGTNIDFTPLFESVSQKLGLCNTLEFPTVKIWEKSGEFYVECESENIVDKCGLFGAIMDKVVISNVGTSLYNQNLGTDGKVLDRRDYKAEVARTRPALWICLNFAYSFINGGYNGNNFATAWYNEEDGWVFRFRAEN
jgi:hypothetical protein